MRLVSPTNGETLQRGMAKPKSTASGLRGERSPLIAVQKSAVGIVVGFTGKASEALQCRKAEQTDRRSRKWSA
jgi:hypothetical protein